MSGRGRVDHQYLRLAGRRLGNRRGRECQRPQQNQTKQIAVAPDHELLLMLVSAV